jgi:small-conductance mechanosensitive channel
MTEIWNAVLQSQYTPIIGMALAVIVVAVFYRVVTRRMRRYVTQRAFKAQNVLTFFFIWRYLFMFTAALLIIVVFRDAFGTLGITVAFVSTLLSWGLKNPIMNIAAWLMIVLRKPYRIGDRVILNNLIGDVKDITITYTLLEQVGGTIGGEEKSGRSLLVPNLHLFNWTIINYTLDEKYILDEVSVRLSFNSDIELVEQLMIKHAQEMTADVIAETGEPPYVRFEMQPWGMMARVRYRVLAVDRQKISSMIVDPLFHDFDRIETIRYAYNKSDASFVPKGAQPAFPPQHPQWLSDGLVRPWFSATRPTSVNP